MNNSSEPFMISIYSHYWRGSTRIWACSGVKRSVSSCYASASALKVAANQFKLDACIPTNVCVAFIGRWITIWFIITLTHRVPIGEVVKFNHILINCICCLMFCYYAKISLLLWTPYGHRLALKAQAHPVLSARRVVCVVFKSLTPAKWQKESYGTWPAEKERKKLYRQYQKEKNKCKMFPCSPGESWPLWQHFGGGWGLV